MDRWDGLILAGAIITLAGVSSWSWQLAIILGGVGLIIIGLLGATKWGSSRR